MGAQSSTPSDAAVNKKLVERLKALELRDEERQRQLQHDHGDPEKCEPRKKTSFQREEDSLTMA